MRRCSRCGEAKSLMEFPRDRSRLHGRGYQCNRCNVEAKADWRRRNPSRAFASYRALQIRRYGLNPQEYLAMLADQRGVCASCGAEPGRRHLAVDHDHACCPGDRSCGRCVRGLLCIACNTLAGQLESPRRIQVEAYLERTRHEIAA